jgi:hypothetical protein
MSHRLFHPTGPATPVSRDIRTFAKHDRYLKRKPSMGMQLKVHMPENRYVRSDDLNTPDDYVIRWSGNHTER